MGIKEFLKPTKWKIILTIIIFILIFLLSGLKKDYYVCDLSPTPFRCSGGEYIRFFNHNFFPDLVPRNLVSLIFLSLIIGEIILSYIISCLIVFIYPKIFRKNKNNRKR